MSGGKLAGPPAFWATQAAADQPFLTATVTDEPANRALVRRKNPSLNRPDSQTAANSHRMQLAAEEVTEKNRADMAE